MELDLLAFAPHPDDVELGAGGLIAKMCSAGYKVGIIDMTRGEMASRGTEAERIEETEEASRIMGIDVRDNLDLGDGHLQDIYEQRIVIARKIREYRPKIVLAPYWEDRHPDHKAASALVKSGSFLAHLKKLDLGFEPHQVDKVIYYMLHSPFEPTFIVDISDFFEHKMRAIQAYSSQFTPSAKRDENTYISQPEFLPGWELRAKYYGFLIGGDYGEPYFLLNGVVRIDDPIDFWTRKSRSVERETSPSTEV